MSNAPVYYALAQVRFNTLALLEQYVPTLQDRLRKAGYPDFETSVVATFNVNVSAPQGHALPAFQQQTRYQFLNENKTAGFLLDQSSISFQSADYDVFAPFSAAFTQGLEILHETVGLSYSERIGLRYLDAVCPKDGEKVSDYLHSSMLGLFEHIGDRTLIHSQTETRASAGRISLIGRATILNQLSGEVAFPVEMQPRPLRVSDKFMDIRGVYAVLDTDCWVEGREKFDLKELKRVLESLQTEIRFSFDQMVTPYALKIWK